MQSLIISVTFLLCAILIWHGIFITNFSQLLANKEIDNKFLGLPTYEYFNDLQWSLPNKVCKLNVWDNYIKFCNYQIYPFCRQVEVPQDLYWIDPYSFFYPMKIESC